MQTKDLSKITVSPKSSIREALKRLDEAGTKIIVVVDDAFKLLGVMTDGDLRRHLLKNGKLEDPVSEAYNRSPIYFVEGEITEERAKEIFIEEKTALIPIVDEHKVFVKALTWEDVWGTPERKLYHESIGIPVVVMAGGKGTRLLPFTTVLPKPLIPVGNKTMLEIIIDFFNAQGSDGFHFILNYKANMIESYLESEAKRDAYQFYREKEFNGTASGLKLLEGKIDTDFIVTNCDVLVDTDFSEVLAYHKRTNSALTIISVLKHIQIPYGVVNYEEDGRVVGISEKPEYSFTISSGVYIMGPSCFPLIPEKGIFHMTDLVAELIKRDKKVSTHFVNESSFFDTGEWTEYNRNIEKLKSF